jgi:hypothetical protein
MGPPGRGKGYMTKELALLLTRPMTFGFLIGVFGLSGCYMSGGISAIDPGSSNLPGLEKPLLTGGDFVAGSGQYELTPVRKYKILSAAGGYQPKVVTKTARGYKVYSSIMGNMISEELEN